MGSLSPLSFLLLSSNLQENEETKDLQVVPDLPEFRETVVSRVSADLLDPLDQPDPL